MQPSCVFQCPLPASFHFFCGFLCLKSLNTGPWYLVCWSMSFIWRMGIATIRDNSSTAMVNQTQSFFDSQNSQLSGFSSSGLWPKNSAVEVSRRGSYRDGGTHQVTQPGLGLLGLSHLLACSSEIAFHLHKLWGIFLLFLQFLLLKFKLLQLLLSL